MKVSCNRSYVPDYSKMSDFTNICYDKATAEAKQISSD